MTLAVSEQGGTVTIEMTKADARAIWCALRDRANNPMSWRWVEGDGDELLDDLMVTLRDGGLREQRPAGWSKAEVIASAEMKNGKPVITAVAAALVSRERAAAERMRKRIAVLTARGRAAAEEHIASAECWCHPVPDSEEPAVWIHNDGTVTAGDDACQGEEVEDLAPGHFQRNRSDQVTTHVLAIGNRRDHLPNPDCWCTPTWSEPDEEFPEGVWYHGDCGDSRKQVS